MPQTLGAGRTTEEERPPVFINCLDQFRPYIWLRNLGSIGLIALRHLLVPATISGRGFSTGKSSPEFLQRVRWIGSPTLLKSQSAGRKRYMRGLLE
ncbi:hypothetical protein MVEN_01239300 [Mycena venus]|uniref:Uncharacterized protein n=1 Tax=Mycena venus TaxID=2733690 RepID=A0A8H6Y6D2_9AGAR|nr:hypothetical protein MVEN_01239300 [Mycena venus]